MSIELAGLVVAGIAVVAAIVVIPRSRLWGFAFLTVVAVGAVLYFFWTPRSSTQKRGPGSVEGGPALSEGVVTALNAPADFKMGNTVHKPSLQNLRQFQGLATILDSANDLSPRHLTSALSPFP